MKHTREARYKAAAALVASGNSKAAASESGIPASTIRHWAQHDEDFQLMCQEVRTEFGESIKFKLAEIVSESADQTLDRLKNGDVVRDPKTGELVRVPVKARDSAIVGGVAFDKLRLAESQPTRIIQHESTDAHLRRLVQSFKAMYNGRQRDDEAEVKRLQRNLNKAMPED